MKLSWKLVVLACLALGFATLILSRQPLMAQESTTKTYQGSSAQILNPERGWWYTTDDVPMWYTNDTDPAFTVSELQNIKHTYGVTLVRKYYVIDDWASRDIPYDASDPRTVDLKMVEDDFAAVRHAGMKLIPRFIYIYNTDDAQFNHHDATEAQIMRHIDQLSPIWNANKDVLNHLQAGFVGCWGEWHRYCWDNNTSRHVNFDGSLTASGVNIYHKLLASTPANRMVAFRYPYQTGQVFGTRHLEPSEYYTRTERARVGMLNDSIAYNWDNRGTYLGNRNFWRPYYHSLSYANVMDGEPSGDTLYSRKNIMRELREDHFDMLNINMPDKANAPLYQWLRDSGNHDVIRKHLGYRFVLDSVSYPSTAARGAIMPLTFSLRNVGWGKVYNPRHFDLVMRKVSSGRERRVNLGISWKSLPKGGESKTLSASPKLPARMTSGDWRLFLVLGDPLLPGRPEYSIQLANKGVWESSTGYNDLGITISVK